VGTRDDQAPFGVLPESQQLQFAGMAIRNTVAAAGQAWLPALAKEVCYSVDDWQDVTLPSPA
jgi:hypothetical protein